MKKFMLVLAILLLVVALPAAAQQDAPTLDQVTGLARYYPESSPFFFSIRIDDAYIQTMSDLIDSLNDRLNLGMTRTLAEELAALNVTGSMSGGTFAETMRPWLGGTMAIGITNAADLMDDKPQNDSLVRYLLAIDVTDQDEAIAFLRSALGSTIESYEVEAQDGYTQFTPLPGYFYSSQPTYRVTSDALLVASNRGALPVDGMVSLDQSLQFGENLALLPEPTYNAAAYANVGVLYNGILTSTYTGLSQSYIDLVSALVSTQVYGFTLLDDRSLVMDVVQSMGDQTALEAAGYPVADYSALGAIDPSFVRYLPAGTLAVWHGTDLRTQVSMSETAFQQSLEMQIQAMQGTGLDSEVLQDAMSQLENAGSFFEGLTGLNIQDDILAWMDGDYLLALDVSDVFLTDNQSAFPFEFALIIDATSNPDAAAHTVAGLGEVLETLPTNGGQIAVSQETIGGGEAWAITIESPDFGAVELVIGSDENVFVIGTRGLARQALAPDGGLDTDPQYQAALEFVPDNAALAAYIFADDLNALIDIRGFTAFSRSDQQAFSVIATLFDQSSLTAWYDENNTVHLRGVLTLPGQ